ncbi:Rrf2 family transcriptional regulator [Gemmiger sp.]|uniref:Rrf2 family transcriptional regulator n=1 Tax=Gemmiger sp. TaxID=2049027 RepID=UPI003F04C3D0
MRSSTQFTVSVQMMILVAIADGQKITSSMIAESTGCNPVMVRQQFGKMKEAGLLRISPGRGTTTLARDPQQITLWDVFAASEGGSRKDLFSFHPNISHICKVGRSFETVLSTHLDDTVLAMRKSLEKVTLAQLIEEIRAASGTER